jgi:hypothetical protein
MLGNNSLSMNIPYFAKKISSHHMTKYKNDNYFMLTVFNLPADCDEIKPKSKKSRTVSIMRCCFIVNCVVIKCLNAEVNSEAEEW